MSQLQFWTALLMAFFSIFKYITTEEVEWLILTWMMYIFITIKEDNEK